MYYLTKPGNLVLPVNKFRAMHSMGLYVWYIVRCKTSSNKELICHSELSTKSYGGEGVLPSPKEVYYLFAESGVKAIYYDSELL